MRFILYICIYIYIHIYAKIYGIYVVQCFTNIKREYCVVSFRRLENDSLSAACHEWVFYSTHKEIFLKSCLIKPKLDCIHHFPIDLEPNGPPSKNPNGLRFDLKRFRKDFSVRM